MRVDKVNGIHVVSYNNVFCATEDKVEFEGKIYDGFYISYNDYDLDVYGDVTTALVLGQMEKFYILNGNHTEAYRKLFNDGFYACFDYFKKNKKQISRFSDKWKEGED